MSLIFDESDEDVIEKPVNTPKKQPKKRRQQLAKKKTSKMEKEKSRDMDKKMAKQKKKQQKSSKVGQQDDEDLDSLIAEMTQSDIICSYAGCKKSTSMLGSRCEFCCNRFCMSHSIPEIHGCGLEAKRKARDKLKRESERPQGFNGGRTLDATKRSQLQRKLGSKIEDLSSDRQRKKKK